MGRTPTERPPAIHKADTMTFDIAALRRTTTAATVALVVAAPSTAQAADWVFTQSGFAGGATVSGRFSTGTDVGEAGVFSTGVPDEITAFQMAFSGNAHVAPFAIDLRSDTVGMTFWQATGMLRFSAHTGSTRPAPFSWDAASDGSVSSYYYARVFGNFGTAVSYTDRAAGGSWTLAAAPVPEPATWLLAVVGGLLLSTVLRRTRSRSAK